MNLFDAFWLSVIQAVTEFLPVSSSGHLRLFRAAFMPLMRVDLRYDLFLHLGTLLAVVVFYRQRLWRLGGSFFRGLPHVAESGFWSSDRGEGVYYATMIVAASVPTAILGFGFEHLVASEAISTVTIGALLVVNAGILFVAHRASLFVAVGGADDESTHAPIRALRPWHAVVIGLAQGLAVFPGISRSGSTIAAALLCGQSRDRSVEFSFFISIVAIGGASLLELTGGIGSEGAIPIAAWVMGFAVTLFGGILALGALRLVVKRGGLQYFAIYCVLLGVLTMVLA